MPSQRFFRRESVVSMVKAAAFVGGLAFLSGAMRVSPLDETIVEPSQRSIRPQAEKKDFISPFEPLQLGILREDVAKNVSAIAQDKVPYFDNPRFPQDLTQVVCFSWVKASVKYSPSNDTTVLSYLGFMSAEELPQKVISIFTSDPNASFKIKGKRIGVDSSWEEAEKIFPQSEIKISDKNRYEKFLKIAPYTALHSRVNYEYVEAIEVAEKFGPSPTKMYE